MLRYRIILISAQGMTRVDKFWSGLQNIDYAKIPITQIVVVVIILAVTQVLRRTIPGVVAKSIDRLIAKTGRQLGDQIIGVIKISTSWLLLIAGLWIIQLILTDDLTPYVNNAIGKSLNLAVIVVIAFFVYRTASVFGRLLVDGVFHTDTELDDLLRLFVPKLFQAIAIVLLSLKGGELFLGASATALVGLLGGAGITLGLLFKDMIYDWFCTVIIYTDSLYKEGDLVSVAGIDGLTQVVQIGFRSTSLYITSWGSIKKIPNSQMINGNVENWSQNVGDEILWGVNWDLKIDGISASQTARICDGLEELPKSVDCLAQQILIRFSQIEGNARVIKIRAFVNDPKLYFAVEKNLNLKILQLLEQEGIDSLYVQLETEPETYQKTMKALQN